MKPGYRIDENKVKMDENKNGYEDKQRIGRRMERRRKRERAANIWGVRRQKPV